VGWGLGGRVAGLELGLRRRLGLLEKKRKNKLEGSIKSTVETRHGPILGQRRRNSGRLLVPIARIGQSINLPCIGKSR
jgi:hypothetical protein